MYEPKDNYQGNSLKEGLGGVKPGFGSKAIMGLAALVTAAGVGLGPKDAIAQDQVAAATINGTNLASYGIPEIRGSPAQTIFKDKSIVLPGEETRIDVYRIGTTTLAVYQAKNEIYALSVDWDQSQPWDATYIQERENGLFREISVNQPFGVPEWVENK